MEKSKKKFLKLPTLDGGSEALRRFIRENLHYPPQALEKGIEGDVIIRFKVTDDGEVTEARIVNGPGHGCEEEALRLLSMIRYTKVSNRGVRLATNNKIRIPFRLPGKKKGAGVRISYAPGKKAPENGQAAPAGGKEKPETYTYSIRLSK